MTSSLTHHEALIYTMVVVSAADGRMSDEEITTMSYVIRDLPAFQGFDLSLLGTIVDRCSKLLIQENGLDILIPQIAQALPNHLRETAYALACCVAASDGSATQEELRAMQIIRQDLNVDRLTSAGIERGVRALFQPAL